MLRVPARRNRRISLRVLSVLIPTPAISPQNTQKSQNTAAGFEPISWCRSCRTPPYTPSRHEWNRGKSLQTVVASVVIVTNLAGPMSPFTPLRTSSIRGFHNAGSGLRGAITPQHSPPRSHSVIRWYRYSPDRMMGRYPNCYCNGCKLLTVPKSDQLCIPIPFPFPFPFPRNHFPSQESEHHTVRYYPQVVS